MTIIIGTNNGGQQLGLNPSALTTHTTVVGMTGSGKTGVVLGIAEELVRHSIPTIILDIKGDMSNIFLQPDGPLKDKIHPRLITPGADHGEPVDVTAGLSDSRKVTEAVTSLLNLIGVPSDPLRSKQHAFLSAILDYRHKRNARCSLVDLVVCVQDPPFEKIGAMEVDEVIGGAARKLLASKLNNVLVAKSFEFWRTGIDLDIQELTSMSDGRVPVVVYSIAHLANEDERDFAINTLLSELVTHMRKSSGAQELKLSFIVDECYGLMPPKGASQSKDLLLTLLKQGRAAGLGVILATQNPMDLDYKGMANCSTWIMGRLQTANDKRRLVEGVCSAVPGLSKGALDDKIGGLHPRHFLLARGSSLVPFLSRSTSCALTGPMDISGLRALGLGQVKVLSFKDKAKKLLHLV